MAKRRKDRLSILPVYGGGEVVIRETPSGRFSPFEKENKLLVLSSDLKGDLRNVAARVAFFLQASNPSLFSGIDTSDPSLIGEGSWEDSLSKLRRPGFSGDDLAKLIVRNFEAGVLSPDEKRYLEERVASFLECPIPKPARRKKR